MINVKRQFSFQALIYFNENILINSYQLNLELSINTECIHEQTVALERLKYFVHDTVQNSLFINESSIDAIMKASSFGLKLCILPEEPYDQILSLMFFKKLNAILENKVIVNTVELSSFLGDDVKFICDNHDNLGPFDEQGWWCDSDAKLSYPVFTNKKEKVIRIIKYPTDWGNVNLSWDDDQNKKCKSAEITFNQSI